MTKKWFSQTRNPPRIPIFYTLTKTHKPNPVGRPIFLFRAAKALQRGYHRLWTNRLHKQKNRILRIEKAKVSQDTILVSMDVTSLYTNIPHTNIPRKVLQRYAKNTKNITTTTLPSHPILSKKCFALSLRRG